MLVRPDCVILKGIACAGPNEAGEDALKAQVDRLLDSVDVCIYLLDYTKLKTQVRRIFHKPQAGRTLINNVCGATCMFCFCLWG